jgi:hypothetical protein
MNDIAIIIVGQMRTYNNKEICESYEKYLNNLGIIDLYINTWDTCGYSNNHGNKNYDYSYKNDKITKDLLYSHYSNFNFFNIIDIEIDCFNVWLDNLNAQQRRIYNTPFRNHSINTTSLPVEYKYQKAINRFKEIKNKTYKLVLFMRADTKICYNIPINKYVSINTIYYHSGHHKCIDHGWASDEITAIELFSKIYDNYTNNFIKIPSYNNNNRDNNEIIIYEAINKNINLKYEPMLLYQIVY